MTGPEPAPPTGDDVADLGEAPDAPAATDGVAQTTRARADGRTVVERVRDVCPYLLAEDGATRHLGPWRGHRCMAVRPPARLALDKQRRLCLVADHLACATYLAARPGDERVVVAPVGSPDLERVTRWSITRTTASVVDPGSRLDGLTSRMSGTAAQAILGGALLVALLAMANGQFVPGGAVTASPSPPPSASAQPIATPSASLGATPLPSATDVAALTSPPTTIPPTPTPTPPFVSQIYVVREGDTLWDIAIAYGTTVKALQELNGLGTSTTLHVGQKLKIP